VLICTNPQLVEWTPDFSSSGQPSPQWTEVRCNGERLTNALNWIDWNQNPVQVELCEECGVTGCARGGYVHVSRDDDFVLWTAPRIDPDDQFEAHRSAPTEVVIRHGAVAIPIDVWDQWCERYDVPAADTF
jgi:hypothetical protein